jgi:beta-phosphoglucomutase-like phosphatase (HAD superfamily)
MAGAEAGALAAGLASGLAAGSEVVVVVVLAQPAHRESKLSTTAERLRDTFMDEYLVLKRDSVV